MGVLTAVDSGGKALIRMVSPIGLVINHGVARSEVDRKPTQFFLDLYKQKTSEQMSESLL
jgi:hypothetical protein